VCILKYRHHQQSGKSIFLRNIDDPSLSKQYISHTVQTTVARFSPSGFWIASGDVSGQVKVWDAVEGVNTKGKQSASYSLLLSEGFPLPRTESSIFCLICKVSFNGSV